MNVLFSLKSLTFMQRMKSTEYFLDNRGALKELRDRLLLLRNGTLSVCVPWNTVVILTGTRT